MVKFLAFCFLTCSPFLQAQTPNPAATSTSGGGPTTGKEISGVVRIIRGQPQTEVFFKDLKDSVIIPTNSKHNQIYEACEISWKKGSPVKLIIDPISRQVLSLPNPPAENVKDSSKATDFKPIESSPNGVK